LNLGNEYLDLLNDELSAMPEDPADGVEDWLLGLNPEKFSQLILEKLNEWLSEEPDWAFEQDYIPEATSAYSAAYEYFREMDFVILDAIGVKVVEGQFPGSTYFAAELIISISEANKVAEDMCLEIRFEPLE
jgi:hypothetical protein